MISKGGIYIRASGNSGVEVTDANDDNIIIVSATDSSDIKTSWSNFGASVDISAPGTPISCIWNGVYSNCWGTSFSVPIVAGVLALVYSVNPNLTGSQAKSILFSTADDLGTTGWDMYYGYGRVNAAKAVALASSTIGTLAAPDTQAPTSPVNVATS